MLKSFFQHTNIPEVNRISELLYDKKLRLKDNVFDEPFKEISDSKPLFDSIRQYSIENNIEELANAQYVASKYLLLFCQLSNYFNLLTIKQFRKSWDALQDCFDSAVEIGRHTAIEDRYEVPQIIDLLTCYERLYPYQQFISTEMIISKSECSICNKPFQSLSCQHIKGNLYWGEVAV